MKLNLFELFREMDIIWRVVSGLAVTAICGFLVKSVKVISKRINEMKNFIEEYNKTTQDKKDYASYRKTKILFVYDNQAQAIPDMYRDAKKSKKIYGLTNHGKIFIDSSQGIAILKNPKKDVKILLQNPTSQAAANRADELKRRAFVLNIKAHIKELDAHSHILYGLHDKTLRTVAYIFDNVLYLLFAPKSKYAADCHVWKVGKGSYLYECILNQFEDLWESPDTEVWRKEEKISPIKNIPQ